MRIPTKIKEKLSREDMIVLPLSEVEIKINEIIDYLDQYPNPENLYSLLYEKYN